MGTLVKLGFFIAFAVKLPMFPFHTWLPDAHTEAPTAGSVILAGLLLKTGAYGMLRFVVLLFPGASQKFAAGLSLPHLTSVNHRFISLEPAAQLFLYSFQTTGTASRRFRSKVASDDFGPESEIFGGGGGTRTGRSH